MRGMGRYFSSLDSANPRVNPPTPISFMDFEGQDLMEEDYTNRGNYNTYPYAHEDESSVFSSVLQRMTLLDGSEDSSHPQWLTFPAAPTTPLKLPFPTWDQRQFSPLFPGSPWSCGYEASRILRFKTTSNTPRSALDIFLKGTSDIFSHLFQEFHCYPSSVYSCKEVLRVESLDKYFVPSRPGHADWIYFGVESCIKQLFMDPMFLAAIYNTFDRPEEAYDAWGGDHLKNLRSSQGERIFNPDNGVYEIGVDWVQPFAWKTYSLGLIFVRSWNVRCALRSKSRFFKCLGILPGPDEPPSAPGLDGHSFQTYLDRIVDDFKSLATGFSVVDYYGRTFDHIPFLVAVSADTPAGAKVKSWSGHTSCLGCDRCNFQGISYKGAVRFLGYLEKSPQYLLYGNDVFWYAHEGAHYSKNMLSHIVGTPHSPVHEVSRLSELPSFDLVHSVLIPSYHKLLEGVVHNFFKFIHVDLGDAKSMVSARVMILRRSLFKAKSLIDPVKYLASHTMEHLKFLICVCAPFLYFGLVKDYQWDMLLLLHKACVYLLTPRFVRTARLKEACKQWLKDFAILAEQNFAVSFFTHNLHVVVCHLVDQEDLFGHSYLLADSWVERCMQFAKRVTKYHAVRDPHLVIGNYILLQNALLHWSNKLCELVLPSGDLYQPRLYHKLTREDVHNVCGEPGALDSIDLERARFYKCYYDGTNTYTIGNKVVVHAVHNDHKVYGFLLLFVASGDADCCQQEALLHLLTSGVDGSGLPWVQETSGFVSVPILQLISRVDVLWEMTTEDGKVPVAHHILHPYVDA